MASLFRWSLSLFHSLQNQGPISYEEFVRWFSPHPILISHAYSEQKKGEEGHF